MEGKERSFMNSNITFAHVFFFHFRTKIYGVYYYIIVNVTVLYYSYMCAIFRCPNKIKICLTENFGYWSAA